MILIEDIPVGIASDHGGFKLKEHLKDRLTSMGIAFKDFGTNSPESSDYADYAHPLANAVEKKECYPGVAICYTGNGISMTLNKHQDIRAALCWTEELARLAREHNDANILTLPALCVSEEEAVKILQIFLETLFEGGRHQRRIDKMKRW